MEKLTDIDSKVDDIDCQHSQEDGQDASLFFIGDEGADYLLGEAQYKQADSNNDRADNDEGASTAPFGPGLVGNDTDDGLDDESRERSRDPDERGIAFCEAQIQEIRCAVWLQS